MSRYVMVFLLVVFLIYISVCSYKYFIYRKVKIASLRFMTSCMLLFTLTAVFYNDIFLNGDVMKGSNEEVSSKNESKVFLSSYNDGIEKDNKPSVVNNHETENKITAYFDNTSPARGSTTNLIVTGPKGGKVIAICQYKGHGTPYIMDIGDNGQAVIPIIVDSNAELGYSVVVDISVSYEGKQYKTNSVFTPH